MRVSTTIHVTTGYLERGEIDPMRMLGTVLELLFDRYGLPRRIGYRRADGSFISSDTVDLAQDYRIGSLLEPNEAWDGPTPVAVEAAIQTTEHRDPVTLTFGAVCTGMDLEVDVDAPAFLKQAGIDPQLILGHIDTLISAAADQPEQRFGAVDILTSRERRMLTEDFNGHEVCYPATTLHQMFIAQAQRTPSAIAMTEGDRTITYRELDAASIGQLIKSVRT